MSRDGVVERVRKGGRTASFEGKALKSGSETAFWCILGIFEGVRGGDKISPQRNLLKILAIHSQDEKSGRLTNINGAKLMSRG